MKTIGIGGKAIGEDENWIRWCNGKGKDDKVVGRRAKHNSKPSVWDLPKDDRRRLLDKWAKNSRAPYLKKIADLMKQYEHAEAQLLILKDEAKVEALRRARVIGCTTNFAAKHMARISAASPTGKHAMHFILAILCHTDAILSLNFLHFFSLF